MRHPPTCTVTMTPSNALTLSGYYERVSCGAINGAWLTPPCNGCLRMSTPRFHGITLCLRAPKSQTERLHAVYLTAGERRHNAPALRDARCL